MISLLIPTWGRPQRLRDAVDSAIDTADRPDDIEILVRVAKDDPEHDRYAALEPMGADVAYLADCNSYGQAIERLQRLAFGEILFAGADDIIFTTRGWDTKVRDAFASVPDQLLVAYANNGQGRRKCEHFFTSRKWVDTVGYMVWPEFRHFCVDQWVEECATAIDRLHFLEDVVVDHRHKKYGKAPNDSTYELVRGATRTSEADNALYAQRGLQREAAVLNLREALGLVQAA